MLATSAAESFVSFIPLFGGAPLISPVSRWQ